MSAATCLPPAPKLRTPARPKLRLVEHPAPLPGPDATLADARQWAACIAADPTTTALWSSGLAASSLICWGEPIALAFCALTISSNQASASPGSKVTASALNSSRPFWRTNAPKLKPL